MFFGCKRAAETVESKQNMMWISSRLPKPTVKRMKLSLWNDSSRTNTHTLAGCTSMYDVWHMTIFYNYVSCARRSMFQSEYQLTENSYTSMQCRQKSARYAWHQQFRTNNHSQCSKLPHQVQRTWSTFAIWAFLCVCAFVSVWWIFSLLP